ncbi:MAG: type II secretion system protein [Lentisphaeraceae bacterium]|nr:type II secretion system protein [Lentisphaeraceae bacterium]
MKRFTLIELLVVIAILGILFTMLLPNLRRAKKTSEAAVCRSNQSQLFKGGMLFTSDNKGHIVYCGYEDGKSAHHYSFDDLLAPYMGRKITQSEINMEWYDKPVPELRCPSSQIKKTIGNWRTPEVPGITRSYAMNAGWSVQEIDQPDGRLSDGITTGYYTPESGNDSTFLSRLVDTGDLLYSGERHNSTNTVGRKKLSGMGSLGGLGEPVHPGLKSIYIFVDGHAEALLLGQAIGKYPRRNIDSYRYN